MQASTLEILHQLWNSDLSWVLENKSALPSVGIESDGVILICCICVYIALGAFSELVDIPTFMS